MYHFPRFSWATLISMSIQLVTLLAICSKYDHESCGNLIIRNKESCLKLCLLYLEFVCNNNFRLSFILPYCFTRGSNFKSNLIIERDGRVKLHTPIIRCTNTIFWMEAVHVVKIRKLKMKFPIFLKKIDCFTDSHKCRQLYYNTLTIIKSQYYILWQILPIQPFKSLLKC